MRIQPGEKLRPFSLQDHLGQTFNTEVLAGRKVLLSFMRFATCPFCNLRVHELVQNQNNLPEDFKIVIVFDATVKQTSVSAERHAASFSILADAEKEAHTLYNIEKSFIGVLWGMIFRMPTLLKSMFIHGHWPFPIQGNMLTMPADFLVDENGIIQVAYYAKDEGDHLPLDQINHFANA